jgi:hypothetical protein
LIQQSDSHDRNAEIAGGFQLITRDIAETTRIDRQRFTQHELHAEVSDATQGRLWMLLLKPGGRLHLLLFYARSFIDLAAKVRVGH